MDTLYKRVVSKGGKISYIEHQPEQEAPTVIEMTDGQMLTVAGALGVTLLALYERVLPPHKRIARKVKAVEDAVLSLFHGSGEPVDTETINWFCQAWDGTMRKMSGDRDAKG